MGGGGRQASATNAKAGSWTRLGFGMAHVIAGRVLRDAVNDLNDAAGLALGDPLAAVDAGVLSHREEKFFHGSSFLSALWDC